ncbi:MAG TPA: glycosyltransferase family 39 protein [Chthoniobacteraceae bacterium]|nr:glycosyltransferase family 39 protein [Chthoniobacteraceae bacterium]
MNTELPRAKKPRAWLIAAIVFVLAFDLAFAWQHCAGASSSELGGHPDEAGHYVSGLMAHDFLAHGIYHSPLKFAEEFYRHYPKAGHGVQPPAFYAVQAAWMLPFGESKTSILLLMGALAAVVAVLLFRQLHDEFGIVPAGITMVLFLSLPLVREYYSLVMAEMLCTAAMFGAASAFGRFLEQEKPSDALWFGLLAALAIMTKSSGLALALVVPVSLLLTGKWHLLKPPALWGGAVVTAVLAGPWMWHFRRGSWLQFDPSWSFAGKALPFYAGRFGLAVGALLALLMIVGLAAKLLQPAERTGRWSAFGALIASVVVFHGIVPDGLESRHLLPAVPAALMFAVAGCAFLTQRFGANARRALAIEIGVAAVLTLGLFEFILHASNMKKWSGFRPLAQTVLEDQENPQGRVLVASDASGDGMFIAEIATAEKRPGHTIDRATKLLADTESSGRYRRAKFADDEELTDFLLEQNLSYIVLDDSVPDLERGAYHDMLKRVLIENTERFWEVATAPIVRDSILQETPVRLYRVQARNRF